MDTFDLSQQRSRKPVHLQSPGTMAEGRITSVDTPNRRARFVVDTYDSQLEFGPSPYTPCPAGHEPVVGNTCLVSWPKQGVESSWIISWY